MSVDCTYQNEEVKGGNPQYTSRDWQVGQELNIEDLNIGDISLGDGQNQAKKGSRDNNKRRRQQ